MKIKTNRIELLYVCPDCGEEYSQFLTDIVQNGTLTCECGPDMLLQDYVDMADLKLPEIGQRIKVVVPIECDPNAQTVPVGETGKVVLVRVSNIAGEDDHQIEIQFDKPQPALEASSDDNTAAFYPECGTETHPDGHEMKCLEQFHHHCNLIPNTE